MVLNSKLFHSELVRHDTIVIEPNEIKEITTRSNDGTVVFSNEYFNTYEIDYRLVNSKLMESMERKGFGVKSIHYVKDGIEYKYVRSSNGIVVQALKVNMHGSPTYFYCAENSTRLFSVPHYLMPGEHTIEDSFNQLIEHGIVRHDGSEWDFLTSDMSYLQFRGSSDYYLSTESHSTVVYVKSPENYKDPYLPNKDIPGHFLNPLIMLVAMVTGCELDHVKLTDHISTRVMSELEYTETNDDAKHYRFNRRNVPGLPHTYKQPDLREYLTRKIYPNMQHLGYCPNEHV